MKKLIWSCAIGSILAVAGFCSKTINAEIERDLRLNQLQSIGTHNSYHLRPAPNLSKALLEENWLIRVLLGTFEYSHSPLPEQFDMGVRQIELDMFLDPEGGLYAQPFGDRVVATNGFSADPDFDPNNEMEQPGLKIIHMQDLDYRSVCLTFTKCLQEMKTWSDNNPQHLPIVVLIEAKDKAYPRIVFPGKEPLDFTKPVKFNSENISEIDREINAVFSKEQLITPDDIRGNHPNLKKAIDNDGWMKVSQARGKIIFLMDNRNDLYLEKYPGLRGATLFTTAKEPADNEAVFINTNEPRKDIPDLVKEGYIVRTRADGDTLQARVGSTEQKDKAIKSGAQYISTDFPNPNEYFSDFKVLFPGDRLIRCNPLNTDDSCKVRDDK